MLGEVFRVKLDCVASDVLGVSGRLMLDALLAGQRDAAALAQLSKNPHPQNPRHDVRAYYAHVGVQRG